MTAPGLLDFFVLEASEYLEQLDGLLAGGAASPDLDGFLRSARGLRGSATMARVVPFAELAGALERVARAVRDGTLPWDRAVGGALVSAVDDLKVLLHAARTWSDDDTAKARARTMELLTMVPAGTPASATPAAGAGSVSFLSNETANVSAGLEFLVTAPGGGGDAGIQVLQRIRALRGIAAIKDVASLPDVLEGAEQAAAPLEAGRPITDPQREVLRHAATILRELALAIRAGRTVPADAVQAFDQALDRWLDAEEGAGDPVVPIASLFHADEGPHVVTATPNPPTTASQRFRLEMVSNGEHLRLIVEEARSADPAGRERYRRHSRRALRSIRRSAESFGEQAVADALEAISSQVTAVDDAALARLALAARRLASPFADPQQLAASLRDAATDDPSRLTPVMPMAAVPAAAAPPAVSVPDAVTSTPGRSTAGPDPLPPTPDRSSDALRPTPDRTAALLERSAAAFGSIGSRPLLEPVALAEVPVVPIGTLVYRGKSALRRALELRDEMRGAGTSPDPAAVEELFDLIELALVD